MKRFATSKTERFVLFVSALHRAIFLVEPHPDWEGKSEYGKYGDVIESWISRSGGIEALEESRIREIRPYLLFRQWSARRADG